MTKPGVGCGGADEWPHSSHTPGSGAVRSAGVIGHGDGWYGGELLPQSSTLTLPTTLNGLYSIHGSSAPLKISSRRLIHKGIPAQTLLQAVVLEFARRCFFLAAC